VSRLPGGPEPALERAFDDALDGTDGLDAVLVAVSLTSADRPLLATSPDDWRDLQRSALGIPFLALRRGLHEILAGGRGGRAILLIDAPRRSGLAAAAWTLEAALVSLVRALAVEYGRRSILCNAVLLDGAEGWLEPLLFLVSGEASFVNGEALDLRPV
jgi:NAD(P)-dependent dehydrogenase (short-subunit alcohol dehydrogenase family)